MELLLGRLCGQPCVDLPEGIPDEIGAHRGGEASLSFPALEGQCNGEKSAK